MQSYYPQLKKIWISGLIWPNNTKFTTEFTFIIFDIENHKMFTYETLKAEIVWIYAWKQTETVFD